MGVGRLGRLVALGNLRRLSALGVGRLRRLVALGSLRCLVALGSLRRLVALGSLRCLVALGGLRRLVALGNLRRLGALGVGRLGARRRRFRRLGHDHGIAIVCRRLEPGHRIRNRRRLLNYLLGNGSGIFGLRFRRLRRLREGFSQRTSAEFAEPRPLLNLTTTERAKHDGVLSPRDTDGPKPPCTLERTARA